MTTWIRNVVIGGMFVGFGGYVYATRRALAIKPEVPVAAPQPPSEAPAIPPAAPSPPAAKSAGRLTAVQLEKFGDLTSSRKEHVASLERKMRDFQKKDPDAKALKINLDQWAALVKDVATDHQLVSRCFAGSLDEAGQKKCGKQVWGFDEAGEIQVAP